jgi:hypothetical protein
MKNILYIILVSGFSLTIISCAEKEESTTTDTTATTDTTVITSSGDSSSAVLTMASLTIGSQTYTNAFLSLKDGCQDTELTDNSNGDKIYYLTTIVYYDNKTLSQLAPFYKDSSCTNKYTETSLLTSDGTFVNPYPFNKIADNITVVQLSNYFDNGTAMPVFDNYSNAVDNGSMYGLIANSDNVSMAGPLLMAGQIYPKSDNEVHASFGSRYACVFTGTDNCTSPDNFTRIQDNVAGSKTLRLEKYSVLK